MICVSYYPIMSIIFCFNPIRLSLFMHTTMTILLLGPITQRQFPFSRPLSDFSRSWSVSHNSLNPVQRRGFSFGGEGWGKCPASNVEVEKLCLWYWQKKHIQQTLFAYKRYRIYLKRNIAWPHKTLYPPPGTLNGWFPNTRRVSASAR